MSIKNSIDIFNINIYQSVKNIVSLYVFYELKQRLFKVKATYLFFNERMTF